MANRVSNFLRTRFGSRGLLRDGQGRFTKNYGRDLSRQGYGMSNDYQVHLKPSDIYRTRERLSFGTRNRYHIDSPVLRMSIDKKVKEVNRNGTDVIKLFKRKCMRVEIEPCESPIHDLQRKNGEDLEACKFCPEPDMPSGQEECGEVFQTNVMKCPACGAATREPDIKQKFALGKKKRKRVNKYNQKLDAILFQLGLDGEKHDNCFMMSDFQYFFEKDPDDEFAVMPLNPTSKFHIQTYRMQPQYVRPIISHDGSLGTKYYTCINHRGIFERYGKDAKQFSNTSHPVCKEKLGAGPLGVEGTADPDAPICGLPLQLVEYVYMRFENEQSIVEHCYIEGEVQHGKFYSPGTAMGVSMIDSLYYIILQLNGQEKWIAEYYLKMRMFKGFLDIPRMGNTGHEKVQQMFASELIKWRQDPWYVPMLSSPAASSGVKYTRIDDGPKEMQFIENRQESRRQISTAFGVSNVFMGDTSIGAGLNNQGLELAVTNRGVAYTQSCFDEQILSNWCASILDIHVDDLEYVIAYNTNEEQDLMAELQRRALEVTIAGQEQQLGAILTYDEDGKIIASAPVEGEPLIPGAMQPGDRAFDGVDGMNEEGQSRETRSQSKPMEGAPNEPATQGSGITTKTNGGKDPYKEMYDRINAIKKFGDQE